MTTQSDYDNWSDKYDTQVNKTRDLDKKATIEILSKYSFENIIELGCGTGKNTQWLVEKAQKIIGLDFSEGMLSVAREKSFPPSVTFQQADITKQWCIPDNGINNIDLITCSLTLEHINNLDLIFMEAKKNLVKGGIFFISELHPYKQYQGSKAKFEESTNETKELEVHVHHISEYLSGAFHAGFDLIELNEWFDDNKKTPRLVSFVFRC